MQSINKTVSEESISKIVNNYQDPSIFTYLGFTGGIMGKIGQLVKFLPYTNTIVTTPCAVICEIQKYDINLKIFDSKELSVSEFIKSLSAVIFEKINNENLCTDSFLFYAHKHNINIFMPCIDSEFAHKILKEAPSLKLDILSDIKAINLENAFLPEGTKTAAIVLGVGSVKHHIFNANLFGDGLNYLILVNTSNEYDGSDSGASINEAISWGKVGIDNDVNDCVKISCDPIYCIDNISKFFN